MKKNVVPRRVFINPVFRDKVTVVKTSRETGGKYLLAELEIAPGGGNILHTHSTFEETFTAITGILGVVMNTKKHYLQPGQSITIPVHTPHLFFNDGLEAVTCHIEFTPAHEGFIKGIAIAYGLATDGLTNKKGIPKSFTHLALLMHLMDTRPTNLPKFMAPVFKWLAGRAEKRGIAKQLLERYYYEKQPIAVEL